MKERFDHWQFSSALRHKRNVATVLIHIRYCSWGGHPKDRWLWEGIVAKGGDGLEIGHGWDYGTRQYLIERCKELGYHYQVHRCKRDGTIQVLESS